ncbi:UDP-Glycosyltransferase/glycogen phosphorylase [Xylariomycetidae sp. FL2044]|nr:UDP-Glycosyltransferase/glycogen phosphorylase [Xylariomycetidae sp. FL2044]
MAVLRQIATAVVVASAAVLLALLGFRPSDQPRRHDLVRGENGTVLFLGLAESGQINVQLATAQALLEKHPHVQVHMASFPSIADKVDRVSSFAVRRQEQQGEIASRGGAGIQFHPLPGPDRKEAIRSRMQCEGPSLADCLMHPPGWRGAGLLAKQMEIVIWAWTAEEHEALFERIRSLIREVNPAVVVADMAFRPAVDATRKENWNHAIMTPLALADVFSVVQPWAAGLWKYPCWGTGFSFPVPWRDIPENIYVAFRIAYAGLMRPYTRGVKKYLQERHIDSGFLIDAKSGIPFISQTVEGGSIPLSVIPNGVIQAGVLMLESAPAAEQDAELVEWLEGRDTVVVNLGSLFMYHLKHAVTMAEAVREVLNSRGDVQVLWKMAPVKDFGDDYLLPLKVFIDSGRLRVVQWISIDTFPLLTTGRVVLSVHHGGSSSFNEAVAAGLPQVVIPLFEDHYNFAQLAEDLGVGLYATRDTAPDWTVAGLAGPILRLLADGTESLAVRQEARRIGELAQRNPGRYVAAKVVADLSTL